MTAIDRRKMLIAGAALAAGCATTPWTPPAPLGVRVIEHKPLPMRDGVRLSARIWIPEGEGRHPAVLEYIPYRKRDLYRPYDDVWGPTLAANGVAFVRIDVRGSGDSEGVLTDEYSEAEIEDGVEAIAWIARQAWCNGAVGMRGMSWGGINTLQVAARCPPALKAIMPMGSCDRRYTDDAHYIGGGLGRTNFQWGVLLKKVMAGPPDPGVHPDWVDLWRQRLNATQPVLSRWLRHQREDEYWKRGSVFETLAAIDVPAYFVSGWSDTYSTPTLREFMNHTAPAKAIIGPWGHSYPYTAAQGLAWAHEEVRWWRHWLLGEANGIMDEPRVRYFMPIATASDGGPIPGEWLSTNNWPPRAASLRYYLNATELGSAASPGPAITHRDKGVVGSTKPEWLDRLPIEQSHDDALSSVFDTAPIAEALEMAGAPALTLHVASDKLVAKVFVRLCEVRPDGTSWLVTWAALNLTRRESMSAPTSLEPGRTYTIPIALRPAAYRFRAGARIRLSISEGFWPMLWPSPATPTLTLPTGVSTLTLPARTQSKTEDFPIPLAVNGGDPAPAYSPASPDANGILTIVNAPPATSYAAGGTLVSSSSDEICEIEAGDPLSSRWRQSTRTTWTREGWNCAVEASYELTADADNFHITETVRAMHDGAEIHTATHNHSIRRDLI